MCGRYYLEPEKGLPELERIRKYIQERFGDEALDSLKTGEVFPGDRVPVLLPAVLPSEQSSSSKSSDDESAPKGSFIAVPMQWGYPGFDKNLLINARAETAADKPTFREAVRSQRCIIPSNGFVEYSHDSKGRAIDKFRFNTEEQGMLYMAGLVLMHEGDARFVILTRAANNSMAMVHHRMPVIVAKEQLKDYLTDNAVAQTILAESNPLLIHFPAAR